MIGALADTTLPEDLGLADAHEDELYEAHVEDMPWAWGILITQMAPPMHWRRCLQTSAKGLRPLESHH